MALVKRFAILYRFLTTVYATERKRGTTSDFFLATNRLLIKYSFIQIKFFKNIVKFMSKYRRKKYSKLISDETISCKNTANKLT